VKTVLIIDDSTIVLRITKIFLEEAGYRVQTMADPGEFHPDKTGMPDLLLVDINMPSFFGDDIVAYFKASWNIEVPIFLFSNVAEPQLQEAVERCGATGYISKGWGMERLIARVQDVLGS